LLSDRDEAMGIEAEDYIASWIEITADEIERQGGQSGGVA
jgi:hypothetical protein